VARGDAVRTQRAQALHRGLRALGLKPLSARLGISESQSRRIAAGSNTAAARARQIDKLYRQYEKRIAPLATAKEIKGKPVRERVNKHTGEITRYVGKTRLPETPFLSAGRQRYPDNPELAKLATDALVNKLAQDVEEWRQITVNGLGVAMRRIPGPIHAVTFHFLPREYRYGKREVFDLASIMGIGSPPFERAARGFPRQRDRAVTIRSERELRRFMVRLLREDVIEIVTVFEGPDEVIEPSYAVIDEDFETTMGRAF
jgi:hypothetical protein